MLVQIENLPDFNAADEVVQEDQAALERDEREREHDGGDNEEMQHEVTNTDALSNMLCSFSFLFSSSNFFQEEVRKTRGKDLKWSDWKVFETSQELEASDVAAMLRTNYRGDLLRSVPFRTV